MTKSELARAIGAAVMRWQDATQAYDEQVGRRFGLNGAERRCLALLVGEGPQLASAIARAVGLTPAAVTALVDRLERRRFVRRRPHPSDRRKIVVEADAMTRVVAREAYAPIAAAGGRLLRGFTQRELETILHFAEGARELQARFTAALDVRGARARRRGSNR